MILFSIFEENSLRELRSFLAKYFQDYYIPFEIGSSSSLIIPILSSLNPISNRVKKTETSIKKRHIEFDIFSRQTFCSARELRTI